RAPGVLKMATVETGRWYACGLDESGLAYCWGVSFPGYGNLGAPSANDCLGMPCNLAPTPVSGGHQFVQLSIGQTHACALTSAGQAWCWGANGGGQLGNGAMSPVDGGAITPQAVLGGITFTAVSAGEGHTCGLSSTGAAYCWGDNFQGQLGGTQEFNALTPSLVKGGLTFASVHAGGSHSCGLTTAGAAYCWGFNAHGQLGDGTTKFRGLPGPVARNLVFVQLAVRRQFACGRTAAGRVYCWGQNLYGQIGAGEINPAVQFLAPTGVGGVP
ncbi:MAG TPA: hypothetical protein VJ817_01955, partial [Gemmatimonadales bacterium]|nr:hypothetical protein [Gemmatimonadales bacterium]